MRAQLLCTLLFAFLFGHAQDDTTAFPQFEDVDSRPVKRYATNRVLYTTPNRFISVGYEYQGAHDISSDFAWGSRRFLGVHGPRVAISTPIISRTKGIVTLNAFYWRTAYREDGPYPDRLYRPLADRGLHSAGIGTTVFKPLNEKNFLIFQGNVDANVLQEPTTSLTGQALTYSATAIYGWKKSDSLMWGLGAARTYRLGRLIYVPVLLYNRTFNERWGVEVLLPARAALRCNFNPKTLATLGFELEGNQYAWYRQQPPPPSSVFVPRVQFLQRGEIKPRLNFERNIAGFWWLAVQAGVRVNGRFVVVDRYDGAEKHEVMTTTLGNPFYFNVSLNLVSL